MLKYVMQVSGLGKPGNDGSRNIRTAISSLDEQLINALDQSTFSTKHPFIEMYSLIVVQLLIEQAQLLQTAPVAHVQS